MKDKWTATTKSLGIPSLGTIGALVLILLVNVLGSWHWVRTNVTLLGGDSTSYLEKSVIFADLLSIPSLRTFFQLLTYDDYRPPLLFIAVQPFYALYGITLDSAQIFNVLCLAAVVLLTYWLGVTIGSRRTALYAALLVGLLPMMAAMARLFYTEIFLTVMVALNLLALIRSDGFARRQWSLWWGASLGVGLLVKWTMPLYLVLPLAVYLWDRDLYRLKAFQCHWRRALAAGAGGLLLSFIWFWPNRHDVQPFLLGNGLWLGWFLIFTLLFYAWSAPRTRTTNFWTAIFLSLAIASLWYLPHIDFATHLLQEDTTRGQEGASPLRLYNYLRNFIYLYEQHLGALAWWLVLPAVLLPWLYRFFRRQPLPQWSGVLWGSLLSAFLVLAWIDQSNARNLVPLLPSIAILAALSLNFYPWRLAFLMGALWVGVLGLQWTMVTFDGMADFYQRTAALWVIENYAVAPASHNASPQYAIQADVLKTITAGQSERQRLGFLIHTGSLHRGSFSYYIRANHINAEIVPLTSEQSRGWYDTLSAPWVLVKDGDNHDISPPAQEVWQRIFSGDPIFHSLYHEVKRYPLPNHETAYLYQRTRGPGRPFDLPLQLEKTRLVADAVRAAWSSQATLIYATSNLAVWVGLHDPARERVLILDTEGEQWRAKLERLTGAILVVWDADADQIQSWFDEHAFRTYEVGDDFAAVAIYGRPSQPLQSLPVAAAWADFRLTEVKSLPQVQPGAVLPITFHADGDLPPGVKLSLRLRDPQGAILASHDRPLQADDRLGLLVPPLTPPGQYDIIAVLYDETTLLPLNDRQGQQATQLFTLTVRP